MAGQAAAPRQHWQPERSPKGRSAVTDFVLLISHPPDLAHMPPLTPGGRHLAAGRGVIAVPSAWRPSVTSGPFRNWPARLVSLTTRHLLGPAGIDAIVGQCGRGPTTRDNAWLDRRRRRRAVSPGIGGAFIAGPRTPSRRRVTRAVVLEIMRLVQMTAGDKGYECRLIRSSSCARGCGLIDQ
jgi:hypothetical protein